MAQNRDRTALRQLDTLFNIGAIRELTDGQLLERFATSRGEAGELAFAALVERHGAMVSRVCRAILRNPEETRDAFQATFLVLVKKARGLWVHDSLGPWLHQVAFRTANYARASTARRRYREQRAFEVAGRPVREETLAPDTIQILHEEIRRLPERYRAPIVLCDLEGRTCDEVARQMACPVGTVKSWRARGRERLRDRLIRRGVAPSVTATVIASDAAHGAMQASDLTKAARALCDGIIAGDVSAKIDGLVRGVLTTMVLGKLRTTAAAIVAMTLLASGLCTFGAAAGDKSKSPNASPASSAAPAEARLVKPETEKWPLTLRDAIRIGLENSAIVRVVEPVQKDGAVGGFEPAKLNKDSARPSRNVGLTIAPSTAGSDVQRVRAETMAHVRSIEQVYWSLAQSQAQRAAYTKGVELANEVLKRERVELSHGGGNVADVAEAEQQLEQANLDLLTKTSDVNTTEQRLRNILGLRLRDSRLIEAVTEPVHSKVEPDWEESVATMKENQPDILLAKAMVSEAQTRCAALGSNNRESAQPPNRASVGPKPKGNTNEPPAECVMQLERQKGFLEQVLHQTTHSLARLFLEVDANHKQYQTAVRVRTASAQRLAAQRPFYEEGRIPIGRYFEAIDTYISALSQEAQFKTTYNISIIALEEARGTLLDFDGIAFRPAPAKSKAGSSEKDVLAVPASLAQVPMTPAAIPPRPLPVGPAPSPDGTKASEPDDAHSKPKLEGKTISFQFSIGSGAKPIEIRGSFTVNPAR